MKIFIAGDFCSRERVAAAFGASDFASVLGEVLDVTSGADYSIVNFECPVVMGSAAPIDNLGPDLKCSPRGVEAVKWAGFDCVTLTNNHFLDFGTMGVKETTDALTVQDVDHVGGGMNVQEAAQVMYKNIAWKWLATINFWELEFSIATESTAGSNPLNLV